MATITYKCPNCDGGLTFDPSTQKYHCEYCLSDFTQAELDALAPAAASEANAEPEGAVAPEEAGAAAGNTDSVPHAGAAAGGQGPLLYTCPSCGAEIVTDSTTAATFCYYCHNPVVLAGKFEGGYQPDFVIPFQIDRKRAQEIFSQWIGKKIFVPREFYSPKQIETMTGVYFPYWLYGCKVDGSVDAQGTSLRVWRSGNMRYTETKIYDVKRSGTVDVGNVARNALKKANRRLVDGVQPFEMNQAQQFSMGYLSGFLAENRDMEREAFRMELAQEVKDFALSGLRSYGTAYDRVQVKSQRAEVRDEYWQYALLPVWTLTYRPRKDGKIYYFALNGQTGKICGELPVDMKRMAILFAGIFLPLLVILLTMGYLI